MRLESLPKINLLVQSDTTRTLVRQLTCLLNNQRKKIKSDSPIHKHIFQKQANTWTSPCIYWIPEPLSAVTHGNPVSRQLCRCFLSPQWSKLPEMLVPSDSQVTANLLVIRKEKHFVHCSLLLAYDQNSKNQCVHCPGHLTKNETSIKYTAYLKGRKWCCPEPLKRRGPSGFSSHCFLRLKHLERYVPCWAATWIQKVVYIHYILMTSTHNSNPRQKFTPTRRLKTYLGSCRQTLPLWIH